MKYDESNYVILESVSKETCPDGSKECTVKINEQVVINSKDYYNFCKEIDVVINKYRL